MTRSRGGGVDNECGKPIVARHTGATFYCAACHKTYQKCQCRVYVSHDTIFPPKRDTPAPEAREKAS